MRACGVTLAAIAVVLAAHTQQPFASETEAAALARSIQTKYASIRDFSADFTHSYEGGVLRKRVTERGQVLIKKPGKMRWQYTAPEDKLFVSDGVKVYSYIPADKQVIVASVPREDEATTPALFLAGKGDVTRDFVPSIADPPTGYPSGSRALKLVPKTPQRDYEWLMLVVDPSTFTFRGLVTVDAEGGKSSFSFTNLKENPGLADKDFAFKIPRGVDVVTQSARQ